MAKSEIKYTVLSDSREQLGWTFPAYKNCLGTEVVTLPTGDYTVEGFEELFVIERKANTSEISNNIWEPRFKRELERLESFAHPFLICEFTLDDVLDFPNRSGIPRYMWPQLKVTAPYILKCLNEIQLKYKVKLIFAGEHGKEIASSLFKRVVELYG